MQLRNGPTGYGVVTKLLHWLTVGALVVQLLLGYGLKVASEWVSGTDESEADESAIFVHGWLGVGIIALATIRLIWRATTPLPPWSERLRSGDRRLEAILERMLYTLLYLIPASGIALLLASGEERDVAIGQEWQPPLDLVDDDVLLALHIAGHIALYVTVAWHAGLALRRRTLSRMT